MQQLRRPERGWCLVLQQVRCTVRSGTDGSYTSTPECVPAPPVPATSRKNPWLAAILNLFIGIGYLYLGYKKLFGMPTILFVFVVLIIDVVVGVFTIGLVALLLALVLAYDG